MNEWIKELACIRKPKKRITIGTDCSGIESPIHCLERLGINYEHLFSSEIDSKCKDFIQNVYQPKFFFDNIFSRDLNVIQDLDIYVCGFPCQSFSIIGKRKGFEDQRGIVFFECLKTISRLKPKVFILENVKHLISHDSGKTMETVLKELEGLEIYNVYWKVLNTKDYGIPQNRPRVYFVGILKSLDQGFCFPKPLTEKELKINDFLEKEEKARSNLTEKQSIVLRQRMEKKKETEHYIINLGVSTKGRFGSAMKEKSPCLLSNARYYYSTKKERFLTTKEWANLQGFDENLLDVSVLTKKQLGNTMSVNVLAFLFQKIWEAVDL